MKKRHINPQSQRGAGFRPRNLLSPRATPKVTLGLREVKVKALLKRFVSPRYFPAYLIALLIILTIFKIHGSSVGMYNEYFYGGAYVDENLIFGSPRPIRSDEWSVLTPFTIAQVKNGFARVNKNVGLSQDTPITLNIPTKRLSIFFEPPNWAFFLMPIENAFAFKWWVRAVFLIGSAYLFILAITRGNYLLAISGSLLLFFTPFIQWWYATLAVEIVAYTFLTIFFLIRIIHFKNMVDLTINSFCAFYFFICYALTFYPPFQIPIGLLALSFITGYALNNTRIMNKERLKTYLLSGASILLASAAVLLAYYLSHQNVIRILKNTTYPGQRELSGGNFSLTHLLNGFFNIQMLYDIKAVPSFMGNQSEASNFLMLFPFILPVILFYLLKNFLTKRKIDFVLLFTSLYLILVCTWMFIGLPKTFANLLFLNLVPHARMLIGVGVASLLLAIYYLQNLRINKTLDFKIIAFLIAAIALFIHLHLGFYFKTNYPAFIQKDLKIFFIALFAFSSVLSLILQKKGLFASTILLFAILSTYKVNPLYRGLSPITNTELSKTVEQIEDQNKDKKRWVAYDTIILGNYLVANGANSINGVHFYPQLELWKKFDPHGKYYSIYNRYAHVVFKPNDDEHEVSFLLDQNDAFSVEVNPCNTILKDLDVKYFVFTKKTDYACLSKIAEIPYPSMPVYIFERL